MNSGSFAAHLRNKWWYRRCVCHARWWDAEPPAGRGWKRGVGKGLQRGLLGTNGGRWIAAEDRERTRCERKGSDVLPVSIIIGGWLTGRRFAPHNSRRPIILPRLPCTNSYITRRHVLPHRYIITQNSLLHTITPFRATIEDCGKPRIRAIRIDNMTIMYTQLSVPANSHLNYFRKESVL